MTRTVVAMALACTTLACTEPSAPGAPPATVAAAGDDAAYCSKLADLALRYTGSSGSDGRSSPTLATRTAIEDCRKGNTAAGIPVLENLLRGNGFTLPKR